MRIRSPPTPLPYRHQYISGRCQQTYHQANLYEDTKITLYNDSLFALIFSVPC